MSTLDVYFETRRIGLIDSSAEGPGFTYDAAWLDTPGAFPVSILMPLSPARIEPNIFLPWVQNLLPEGGQLRAIGTTLGAAADDVIGILNEIGRDTAGALSIGKPGSTSPADWRPVTSQKDLERILEELPSKPFLAGEDGVSMSLAGVQSKLGVALDGGGRICIPLNGSPSTHILKPDSTRLSGSVQNEALCLTLARRCGLSVPDVTTGTAGARRFFLISRYDRLLLRGRWRRLHQEDFCQALGKPPASKYEANQTGIKGPTAADMVALARRKMGAREILVLLDHLIFNVLACNTDAHAKNYSLMISGRGFDMTPLYDVMCAEAWDGITRNLAQTIAGKNRGEHLKRRHWEAFAQECGLNGRGLIARVRALAASVAREVAAAADAVSAMPAGPHPLMPVVVKAIEARARAMTAGLDESEPLAVAPAKTKAVPARKRAKKRPTR